MSDQTPFDCRANHKATFDDISPVLLEEHLKKTGSKLAKQVRERGVEGKRFVSRYYRNRRLGEFLKELDLSEGHSSGVPTIQEELERNGSQRAEFFTDEDRRALRVRIPIHPAFLENTVRNDYFVNLIDSGNRILIEKIDEKAMKRISKKTQERYISILNYMNDKEWHKTSEIVDMLGLKETRTKELLRDLVEWKTLEDNGMTKGKMYRKK